MKLKDIHADIERYLKEDCYCPNEVYSVDGFFYQIVYADAECELLGKYISNEIDDAYLIDDVYLVATENSEKEPILLNIWCNDKRVVSMERYELTENNIKGMKNFWENGTMFTLSEMQELKKDVAKIMSISDAIMV